MRRTYIPKGDGRYRALGVPSFEDRLVQDRLSRILQAIWEPEFCDRSFGFRPGCSAHDALRRVAEVITNEGTQWVVEADIRCVPWRAKRGRVVPVYGVGAGVWPQV